MFCQTKDELFLLFIHFISVRRSTSCNTISPYAYTFLKQGESTMPIDFTYITAFLQRMENAPPTFAPSRKGYVPMRNGAPIGASGVTIGTGVDLGQQSVKSLNNMGVSASLTGQLTPYLGLKKMTAVNKLKALPLVLSPDAVNSLDLAVISSYARATAVRFNRMAERASCSSFESRPKQVQAVAVSLEYQLGAGGASKFTLPLAQASYAEVIELLRSQQAYTNRRNKEASLIAEVLNA